MWFYDCLPPEIDSMMLDGKNGTNQFFVTFIILLLKGCTSYNPFRPELLQVFLLQLYKYLIYTL